MELVFQTLPSRQAGWFCRPSGVLKSVVATGSLRRHVGPERDQVYSDEGEFLEARPHAQKPGKLPISLVKAFFHQAKRSATLTNEGTLAPANSTHN